MSNLLHSAQERMQVHGEVQSKHHLMTHFHNNISVLGGNLLLLQAKTSPSISYWSVPHRKVNTSNHVERNHIKFGKQAGATTQNKLLKPRMVATDSDCQLSNPLTCRHSLDYSAHSATAILV